MKAFPWGSAYIILVPLKDRQILGKRAVLSPHFPENSTEGRRKVRQLHTLGLKTNSEVEIETEVLFF